MLLVDVPLSNSQSTVTSFVEYYDKDLQEGGIVLDSTSYAEATDRVYDVRGFQGFFLQLLNEGANPFAFTVEAASKAFDNLSELQDADFQVSQAEEIVAGGAGTRSLGLEVVRATSSVSAVRVRLRKTTVDDATIGGTFSVR